MTDEKKKTYDRRNFLTGTLFASSAMALNPFKLLLDGMVAGICDKAYAQDINSSDILNYIHLSMGGGCPRWMFDLPLRPNGLSDSIGQNLMLITGFDDSQNTQPSYQVTKHGNYYYPKMWEALVSDGKGGLREVKPLLNHMINFRGVNLQIDGHTLNREKQDTPVSGGYSLSGLNVDNSNAPIPGAYISTKLGYKSKTGIGIINASGGNPISTLLTPFQLSSARSVGTGTSQDMINSALAKLEAHAQDASSKSKTLFNDRKNAKKLFEKEFGNLSEIYNDLVSKYEKIISDTLSLNNMSFLDTNPIITQNSSLFNVQASGGKTSLASGNDLRDSIIVDGRKNISGTAVSNRNTTISSLSRAMAVSEYLLVNNLSTTLDFGIGSLVNLMLPATDGIKTNQTSNNDAHETGAITTMYFFTKYFLSISACLLELTDVLKATNVNGSSVFSKTVINLSSEFNRSARKSGSGSDHGWRGSSSTLITGLANESLIIGDIQANYTRDSSRSGGWGVAVESDSLSGREMLIGNVASSIASLLSIPSPTQNDQSLLSKSNLGVKTHVSKPKNV